MNVALRPMGLGEILDRTLAIYRARFSALAMIAAPPAAGMLALRIADDYWWHLTSLLAGRGLAFRYWNMAQLIAYGHVAILMYAVFTGAMIHQTSAAMFSDAVPARSSLRFAFDRWRSFFWLGVLELTFIWVAAEAIAGGTLYALGSGLDALGLFNGDTNWAYGVVLLTPLIGGIILLLWLTGCFAFLVPACAVENVRGRKALQRSWILSRERRWPVALAWALLFLLRWTLVIGFQWALRSIVLLMWTLLPSGHHVLYVAYRPATHVLNAILAILTASLYPIASTLFYYDQRIRKEGFDIEWMMKSAGMVEGVAAVPAGELGA